MASSLYHGVGHTITGADGTPQFVCSGGECFQSTFATAAALCIVFALLPTLALLWVSNMNPVAGRDSLALQVRMQENFMEGYLRLDLAFD
jgi:hypothetical protein